MRYFLGMLLLASLAIAVAIIGGHYRPASAQESAPVAGAVVKIISGPNNTHGTGVSIGDRIILTAGHVVDDFFRNYPVVTDSGRTVRSRIVLYDRRSDVALLEILDVVEIATVPVACRAPVVGEEISTLGSPRSLDFITTWGRVAGESRMIDGRVTFVADLTVASGSSGGPIFDSEGMVIGIAVALMSSPNGVIPLTLAIPAPTLCRLMDLE